MNEQTKEILGILQEECAEVIVEVSKCLRFGIDQMLKNSDETNIQRLERELGDLQAMIQLLVREKTGVSRSGMTRAKHKKFEKLKLYSNIKL